MPVGKKRLLASLFEEPSTDNEAFALEQLPEDLLAHVLRFVTGSIRRDGEPGIPTKIKHLKYASISPAFRSAFLQNMESLALTEPPARKLADMHWTPLRRCTALRKLVIEEHGNLANNDVIGLFKLLSWQKVQLHEFHVDLNGSLTALVLLHLVIHFGNSLTKLSVNVSSSCVPKRSRTLNTTPNGAHPAWQLWQGAAAMFNADEGNQGHAWNQFPPWANNAIQAGPPGGPPDPQAAQGPVPPQNNNPPMPGPLQNPHIGQLANPFQINPNLAPANQNLPQQQVDDFHAQPPLPNAAVYDEVAIESEPDEDDVQPMAEDQQENIPVAGANQQHSEGALEFVHVEQNLIQNTGSENAADTRRQQVVEVSDVDKIGPNNIAHDDPEQQASEQARSSESISEGAPRNEPNGSGNGDSEVQSRTDPLPPWINFDGPHLGDIADAITHHDMVGQPNLPDNFMGQFPPSDGTSLLSPGTLLTDRILTFVVKRTPALRSLALSNAKCVGNNGIISVASCSSLESLTLSGMSKVSDGGMRNLILKLGHLRELSITNICRLGEEMMRALVVGECRKSFESLTLVHVPNITDSSIRMLVNGCEFLKSVALIDCQLITSTAVSHLSCSRKLQDVAFSVGHENLLTDRATIHMSCASPNLQSLSLGRCDRLTVDGIVALSNLPGLRKLHMKELRNMSHRVMRALGAFPRLNDLRLEGALQITDLDVKVLCGQRGHRFLHLGLVDSTVNLSDDALECIMTWCGSLRSLEISGNFQCGALERVHESIPNASLKITSVGGTREIVGCGGIWD